MLQAETDITEDDGASTVHGGAADTIAPPPDAIGVGYGVPPDLGVADDASAKSGGGFKQHVHIAHTVTQHAPVV